METVTEAMMANDEMADNSKEAGGKRPGLRRRDFLRGTTAAASGAIAFGAMTPSWFATLQSAVAEVSEASPESLAGDERFWASIRREWNQSADFINLESGYYTPSPTEVLDARCASIRRINETPSYYMRTRQFDDRERIRAMLAELAGCPAEEVALTRNTTESLNIVLHGLELPEGAELVYAEREYPSMKEALEQRAQRYGLALRKIQIPDVPESPEQVIDIYRKALGPKTRALLISHLVYLNGQVLPVREIAEIARERGIEVIVDGAHSFAHIDYKVPDLGGDYFGASLHKWLAAPLGLGILWMRKDRIEKVWPLFGDVVQPRDDIRKFEHQGTQPVSSIRTLANAIRFHKTIGAARKEARLRYLKDSWVNRVADLPRVRIHTPRDPRQSCAIANIEIDGMTPKELADALFERFRIFTVAVSIGVRVAPNLFTRPGDLDAMVKAIRTLAD